MLNKLRDQGLNIGEKDFEASDSDSVDTWAEIDDLMILSCWRLII